MLNSGYLGIKRDNELIAAGSHFWCNTHLTAVPLDDQSPDPRYCQGCCEFLLKEAKSLPSHGKKTDWIPVLPKELAGGKAPHVPHYGGGIMSTVKGEKSEVDIIQPTVPITSIGKRGPKFTELPDDLIRQWGGQGMGSKAIAARLKGEHGIEISYKTIQRRLQGVLL